LSEERRPGRRRKQSADAGPDCKSGIRFHRMNPYRTPEGAPLIGTPIADLTATVRQVVSLRLVNAGDDCVKKR
jgi:hypothetical protein